MTAVCTLGLDLGTSSAKAVVVDTGGEVLAQASAGYTVTSAVAGYAESEPAQLVERGDRLCPRGRAHGGTPLARGRPRSDCRDKCTAW